MSTLDAQQMGRLLSQTEQNSKAVCDLTRELKLLRQEINNQNIQLAKSKGAAAAVITIATMLGALGAFFSLKVFD